MSHGWWRKSRKNRRTAKQLYADLVQLANPASYGRIAASVRSWRKDRGGEQGTTDRGPFMPLVIQPGQGFQLDWSEDWANWPAGFGNAAASPRCADCGAVKMGARGLSHDPSRERSAQVMPTHGPTFFYEVSRARSSSAERNVSATTSSIPGQMPGCDINRWQTGSPCAN